MENSLHQINVSYVDKEDRLLLRITTKEGQEYRIWLTRRYTGLLFDVLNREMNKSGGAAAVGASRKTSELFKSGALDREFQAERTTSYPLGEAGILAYAIKAISTAENGLQLEILPEKGQGMTLNLNQSLIYILHNLISRAVTKAVWRLPKADGLVPDRIH